MPPLNSDHGKKELDEEQAGEKRKADSACRRRRRTGKRGDADLQGLVQLLLIQMTGLKSPVMFS